MSTEKRIVDLEARVAFLDRLVAQLDEVVREFATRVEGLEWQIGELRDSKDAGPIGPANDPPPHY